MNSHHKIYKILLDFIVFHRKGEKVPQTANSTWAGTWYCNQFLHGDREIRMIAIAQEQTKRSIILMSVAFTRQNGNGNSPG